MSQPVEQSEPAQGSPQIGLTTLVALVVANMIGAGVFTSSGYSLAALGNPGRVMLAWVICAVWAVAGAVAYGALVSRLPLSGGEYLFLSRLVHPAVGFLAGWISLIAGFTAPIALAAQGAAVYVAQDGSDLQIQLVATMVILLATVCHLAGISIGSFTQNTIVFIKLVLLLVIIGMALVIRPEQGWQGGPLPDREPSTFPLNSDGWFALLGSMSWIALSYTGFNAAIYVAGNSRQAQSNVPRAMLWATLGVTAIYLTLNAIFVFAPSPQAISGQENVASIAARAIAGEPLEYLVRITITLAMVTSVFSMLLAGPHVYAKMAEDGVMPRSLKELGTPRRTIVLQALLSIVAVFAADLLQLMTYLGLTLSACSALTIVSLWWIRLRLPAVPVARWWESAAAVIYVSLTVAILFAAYSTQPLAFRAMLYTFAIGGLVYVVSRFMRR